MMAPFCVLTGSLGRPSLFQDAMEASVVNTFKRSKFGVDTMGTARSLSAGTHFCETIVSRNSRVNGPCVRYKSSSEEHVPNKQCILSLQFLDG